MTQKVSKEVEDEANGYFQRIYGSNSPHPTLSIDEVLDMLQRFKESSNEREREVQQCMVRNLFEEYRFFPQYPDKELQITAQLFGGIIERNLVSSAPQLGLALRYVLEALRKPEGSKMYYFGITSLDRFKNRLHLYTNYCDHLKMITNFNEFPSHLIEYVKYGANGIEPPTKPQSQAVSKRKQPTTTNKKEENFFRIEGNGMFYRINKICRLVNTDASFSFFNLLPKRKTNFFWFCSIKI